MSDDERCADCGSDEDRTWTVCLSCGRLFSPDEDWTDHKETGECVERLGMWNRCYGGGPRETAAVDRQASGGRAMTSIPNESDKPVGIRTRQDGKHVLKLGGENAVLDDGQLALLGRVAVARAIDDPRGEP